MPERRKFSFIGSQGAALAASLELPDQQPVSTVLFAHCFTCSKDNLASSRIARALVRRGHAVMRFDFTGLGSSEGDFSNTNFSSNVEDLLAAAQHLRDQGMPPTLLVGHSLGGTAILAAAGSIAECRGIVTIAAPADAQHLRSHLTEELDTIERDGKAEVSLGGRPFTIRRQFLEDIDQHTINGSGSASLPILIMHSPMDTVVGIEEAEKIFRRASHPRSFISLDTADHLLTSSIDAEYVAEMIAIWAARLFDRPSGTEQPRVIPGEIAIHERDHRFLLDIFSDAHHWLADEPIRMGGSNLGPDPYEHLLAAVGSCTAMTVRLYAQRKQWPLDDVQVVLRHRREHLDDCQGCEEKPQQLVVIERDITLLGELDDEQQEKLMGIADKCPVHKTLTGRLSIQTRQVNT